MQKDIIGELRSCPVCHSSWDGDEIPANVRHMYAGTNLHFSRLRGIEVRGGYDGVSIWICPDCGSRWDRFTAKLIPPLVGGIIE